MYVTNLNNKSIKVIYKVFNVGPQTEAVPALSTVNIPELTEVSQVIFNSYDKRLRDLDAKFPNRAVEHSVEFRDTPGLSGATL